MTKRATLTMLCVAWVFWILCVAATVVRVDSGELHWLWLLAYPAALAVGWFWSAWFWRRRGRS